MLSVTMQHSAAHRIVSAHLGDTVVLLRVLFLERQRVYLRCSWFRPRRQHLRSRFRRRRASHVV